VTLAQRLGDLSAVRSIPFNRREDFDARGKLRPEAPVYSPFIRHRAERVFD
jgi:NAD(P)H dehydrogenase (quinone)